MRHAPQNALASVIGTLAAEKSPACLLDTQGVFLFVNEAWDRHAAANGGAPGCLGSSLIGTPWLGHIRGETVRRLHATLLDQALRWRGPHARPVVQVGEVNTPTVAALVSSRFEPVLQGAEPLAVRIVHATLRERPVSEVYDLVERPPEAYRDAGGAIVQCSCCRRVRDPSQAERWDFVPALVAEPLETAQEVCELCAELHYVGLEASGSEPHACVVPAVVPARACHGPDGRAAGFARGGP